MSGNHPVFFCFFRFFLFFCFCQKMQAKKEEKMFVLPYKRIFNMKTIKTIKRRWKCAVAFLLDAATVSEMRIHVASIHG